MPPTQAVTSPTELAPMLMMELACPLVYRCLITHYTATGDGSSMGPDRLFAILEEAVPRPDANLLLTAETLQRSREDVEQAWDQVRRWFWAHESQEERAAAAYIRGQADVTPLHLMQAQ
jgi:hypothetical protein